MTLEEFMNQNKAVSGYMVASLTDRYIVDTWPTTEILDEKKVLEVRIFNQDREARLFRTDIGKAFSYSLMDDTEPGRDYMDEWQYLDVDTKKSEMSFAEQKIVYATGGGKYRLPLERMENAGVLIRTYFTRNEETGLAQIGGFRLVTFGEVRKNG